MNLDRCDGNLLNLAASTLNVHWPQTEIVQMVSHCLCCKKGCISHESAGTGTGRMIRQSFRSRRKEHLVNAVLILISTDVSSSWLILRGSAGTTVTLAVPRNILSVEIGRVYTYLAMRMSAGLGQGDPSYCRRWPSQWRYFHQAQYVCHLNLCRYTTRNCPGFWPQI
ncbi:hypothetical protein BC628DRAFT_1350509, partial [Trametes gibbosa]